ncbi:MAG: 50S ribosomal protein L5 [Nanoarchaeota archaeon]|nr:50S ribosomal protein L5 [Nanoarchaeota archaeon]MBU4123939.1 50S ribosomal protein L5 [Nanoarchaeota archaeon]
MNTMRDIRIAKVTINIGCGEAGDKLDKANKLMTTLTGKKVVVTSTDSRTTFGMPKGKAIGCKVTLRRNDAIAFLKKAFEAVENTILGKSFDRQGNFAFGIKEHIDIPGVKYEPEIGIYGMDVCVTLERRGYRVSRKKLSSTIGSNHVIKPEEAKDWLIKSFGVKIE